MKKLLYIWLSSLLILSPMILSSAQDRESNSVASVANSEIEFNARLRNLEEELRCLVCQNQSLADSHADLANDLRREVEQLARQGKTDQEIINFLKARYGDFISYRPPFNSSTALLWIAPVIFFIIALLGLVIYTRRRRNALEQVQIINTEKAAQVRKLLGLEE